MNLRVEFVVRPHLTEEEVRWLPWVERCLMQAAEMEQTPPFSQRAQPFTLPDNSLRYHVWAEWRLRAECVAISAWLGTTPALHILAAEQPLCELNGLDPVEPRLRNVVDLGGGRMALIVSFEGGDGRSLELLEYRDGVALANMRKLQSISAGE